MTAGFGAEPKPLRLTSSSVLEGGAPATPHDLRESDWGKAASSGQRHRYVVAGSGLDSTSRRWLGRTALLCRGGWLNERRRESDDKTARHADFNVTNCLEIVLSERQAGVYGPIERGVISWDEAHNLGEIFDGTFVGRADDAQISFHGNNNGTAATDLAIAQWVYTPCKQIGRGTRSNCRGRCRSGRGSRSLS